MTTITREQLHERARRKVKELEFAITQSAFTSIRDGLNEELELARIALASLEAEPVCVIDQSNLDYLKSGSDADVWPASRTEMGDVLLYRTAPPAPVSVPDAMEMDDDFDSAFEHGKAVGWNACRTAMLQGGQPVSNRDELQVIGWLRSDYNSDDKRDPNAPLFMLGRNDPSETWGVKYIPLSGNSPVIPCGWISCSERMPDREYVLAGDFSGTHYLASIPNVQVGIYADWFDDEKPCWDDGDGNDLHLKEVTHWMPLPEPPQQ